MHEIEGSPVFVYYEKHWLTYQNEQTVYCQWLKAVVTYRAAYGGGSDPNAPAPVPKPDKPVVTPTSDVGKQPPTARPPLPPWATNGG